jgi:hypothetical protein
VLNEINHVDVLRTDADWNGNKMLRTDVNWNPFSKTVVVPPEFKMNDTSPTYKDIEDLLNKYKDDKTNDSKNAESKSRVVIYDALINIVGFLKKEYEEIYSANKTEEDEKNKAITKKNDAYTKAKNAKIAAEKNKQEIDRKADADIAAADIALNTEITKLGEKQKEIVTKATAIYDTKFKELENCWKNTAQWATTFETLRKPTDSK